MMKSQEQIQDQEQQLTDKTRKRRRLLKKIIRNNRQIASDKELQILLCLDKELYAGYNHYRLGNFCIQENRLDLAQENLSRARQLIEKKFLFTNVYLSLGNLQLKRKDNKKAIEYFTKVIIQSPHRNSKVYLNKDQVVFAGKLNSFNSYVDAHNSLIELYVQMNQFEKGFEICKASIQFKQEEQSAIMNFADIIERLLGNRDQALSFARNKLTEIVKSYGDTQFKLANPIKLNSWNPHQTTYNKPKKINIFTVKWGSKYSFEYVNNLYAGIKRNTTWDIDFYCLTDDSYGIDKRIKIKQLDDQWKKQWGKALLFDQSIQGKHFYVDLDVVITGNLDQLFQYQGSLAMLKKQPIESQRNSQKRFNSTVMIWQGCSINSLRSVYQNLSKNFHFIQKKLVKFDYWLDIMIEDADAINKIYPDKIVNFNCDVHKVAPENASIVCFQKSLKPAQYPVEWVRNCWVP